MNELKPCALPTPEEAVDTLNKAIRQSGTYGFVAEFEAAARLAISALGEQLAHRAQPDNAPLTLEELRGMDGDPVWVETGEIAINEQIIGRWALITEYGSSYIGMVTAIHSRWGMPNESYGKTWLAYRRKPEPEGGGLICCMH